MNTEHADGGTVLQRDECAIVLKPDGRAMFAIPNFEEGEDVPEHVLAMTAMFIRWQQDPEWVEELVQWFKDQAAS